MKDPYKKIMEFIENVKDRSNRYDLILAINIDTIIYLSLIIIAITTLSLMFQNNFFLYLIICISSILNAYSLKKYGYKKLLEINLTTIYILFLYFVCVKNIYMLPIVIVLSEIPIKEILRKKKIKKLSNFFIFEEKGFRGCNLILKEITPIKIYDELIKINIKLKKEISLNEIKEFNDNFSIYMHKKNQLFMGFKYYNNIYEVYLYTKKIDMEDLKNYLNNNINYEYDIKCVKDKKYKFYKDHICPSEKLFMHMCNKNILSSKLPINVDLYEEQLLVLVLAFKDKEQVINCMKHLEETKEYEKINYDDNQKNVKENNLNEKYNYLLYVKQKTRIGLSKLNMITDKMFDLAEDFNGTFEEWGLASEEEI